MIKLVILFFSFIIFNPIFSQENRIQENNFECLTETRVSGLFQYKRKFLKETEFFSHKTIFNFSDRYSSLTEKESTKDRNFEAKYQFYCKKEINEDLLFCRPIDKNNNTYNILFSLKTLRYRKTLITDYWLHGRGNEVDYVHIAHGYCYNID